MVAGSLALWALAAGTLTVGHEPIACMVRDRFPQVDATVEPASEVAAARVYFTRAEEAGYYVVEMTGDGGRFVGRLPKPKEKSGPVVYFIEVVDQGGAVYRSPETRAEVVKKREDCPGGGKVALEGPKTDVRLFSTEEKTRKPKGFSGVASVATLPTAAGSAEPPGTTGGAPPAVQPTVVPPPTPRPPPVATEYQIGPEDILKVTVFGHDDLTQTLIVQADGTFLFPLVGRVKASEMTPAELQRKLGILLGQGFIRNPQVNVLVQEYRSKTVMVMGEVNRPGTYPLSGGLRLMDVLARAGIPSNAIEAQIVRPVEATDRPLLPSEVAGHEGADPTATRQADILRVDLRAIQAGDLEKNIPLLPNDTVYVPSAPKFFVSGETKSPGAYPLTPGLTIRQAIIVAGGFTPDASTGRIRVVREVNGEKKELKVKLDDGVQPGDIIVVKGKLF